MKLERTFKKGKQEATLVLEVAGKKLVTVLAAGGKEKRREADATSYAFRDYANLVKKQLKAGFDAAPLPDAPKAAEALLGEKKLDVGLDEILDAFTPEERAEIVEAQIARAEKAGKVVGPDAGYQRAAVLAKAPTQPLLRHYLSSMLNGKLKYRYAGGGMNGDLFFFATAISNAARDPKNRAWVVSEVEKTMEEAEPLLKKWLQARIGKFHSQAKVAKQLTTAPGKPEKTEEGLLEAIGKSPEDDGPRQVWADWLLEHGNKWGEVVNLQCELARLESSRDPRWREVYDKVSDLKTPNVSKFLAPIRAFLSEYDVERGLLSRLTVSADKLLKPGAAKAIVLRAPGARLELKGLKAAQAKAFAKLPAGRFSEIKIPAKPPAEALAALLQSPLVDGARSLEIWNLDAKGAAALASTPASVRELSLWHYPAAEAAIAALAKSAAAKEIEGLFFPFSTPQSIAAIESLKSFPKLSALQIAPAAPGAGRPLGSLKHLHTLTIAGGKWDDADAAALAKAGAKPARIEIRESQMTGEGAASIFATGADEVTIDYAGPGPDFSKIGSGATSLALRAPGFGDAEAKSLAASAFAKKLEYLSITSEALKDDGAKALLKLSHLKGHLSLEGSFSSAVAKQVKAFGD